MIINNALDLFRLFKKNDELVTKLINENKVDELKEFLETNNTTIEREKIGDKYSILMEAIDNDCSGEMIQLIIDNCQCRMNAIITHRNKGATTPLLYTLIHGKKGKFGGIPSGNFEIADVLLKNGANINSKFDFTNIIADLNSNDVLTEEKLKYVLDHDFDVSLIDSFLISNLDEEFIEIIFEHPSGQKINIENEWYMELIDKEKYLKIGFLIKYDKEGNFEENFMKVISLLQCYDNKHHTSRKYKFIKEVKHLINQKANTPFLDMDSEILNKVGISNIDGKRNEVIRLIERNNKADLESYIINEKIPLKELNSESFDSLIYAIEHNASSEIIKYIIQIGQYNTFDYSCNINNSYKTPFLSAVSNERFETANYLIKNGANPNFKLTKLVDNTPCNFILNYLYDNDHLNCDIIEYVFSCDDLVNIFVSNEFVYKLFENEEDEMISYLNKLNNCIVNYPLYKRAFVTGDGKMLEKLFETDEKSEEIKISIILEVAFTNEIEVSKFEKLENEVENLLIQSILQELRSMSNKVEKEE